LPIYYVVREALTNVHKHAGATHISVTISTDGTTIDASVTDDGSGGATGTGGGIDGMRARIIELGGQMYVSSNPRHGTTVRVEVPCVSS
ncbi:ATP-binding protein, partial [Nostoc sp. NIES-2111]